MNVLNFVPVMTQEEGIAQIDEKKGWKVDGHQYGHQSTDQEEGSSGVLGQEEGLLLRQHKWQ